MTMSKPRFTAPAANAALAQCMTPVPALCAASWICQVAQRWGCRRAAQAEREDRSAGPI